jgi:4-aminobutyrate aminotransferase-like enzyme
MQEDLNTTSLFKKRMSYLGNGDQYFYKEPLHITKGEDVWLFDKEGKKYLDVYNNVAHVGHCNPVVVDATVNQAAKLNTNTRYLHEHIVALAEAIIESMPEGLNVCYFCCSGSEANDLAFQIARNNTGNKGCLVTENAYHGNTTTVFQMSPEDCTANQRESWIGTIPGPQEYLEDEVRCIQKTKDQVTKLKSHNHSIAAFIADNIFSSEGIYLPREGYLQTLYALVKDLGGLTIADEVQSGFGRTGDFMWGFEHSGVVPDIVTLGKPMGNGHPISAVITTREIADSFNRDYGYFNTFGGNPVSCAAGLAVIKYIKDNNLVKHAKTVGNYFQEELVKTIGTNDLVKDIRGSGLFIGIEMKDEIITSSTVEQLMNNGVLVGQTGPNNNVMKLRPPMTFQKEHADFVVQQLEKIQLNF